MPQENGHHGNRQSSSRSIHSRASTAANDDGIDRSRRNRELRERGYYSELATIDPDTRFQVKQRTFSFVDIAKLSKL